MNPIVLSTVKIPLAMFASSMEWNVGLLMIVIGLGLTVANEGQLSTIAGKGDASLSVCGWIMDLQLD